MFCLLFTLASKFVPIIEVSGNAKEEQKPEVVESIPPNVLKEKDYEYAS